MGLFQHVKSRALKVRSSSATPTDSRASSPVGLDNASSTPGTRNASARPSLRKDFLCVEPGQSFQDGRYVLEKKLGAGSYSEVWLANDSCSRNTRVAIKFLSNDFYNDGTELWELEIMQHVRDTAARSRHPGRHHVALILDHFEHPGSPRPHVCMVFELLGPSIEDALHASSPTRVRLPYQAAKSVSRQLLQALDFVHTECGVIHTDITVDNVLQDRRLVSTNNLPSTNSLAPELRVRLSDFGSASWVDRHLTDHIQRPLFRAPEVTLKSRWDTSADIFDLGCFIYQVVTGSAPFPGSCGLDCKSVIGEQDRLRQLTRLFGPIPDVVLNDAMRKNEFFDKHGGSLPSLPPSRKSLPQLDAMITARSRASSLGNDLQPEDMHIFCDFLCKTLATDPRLRLNARALLAHPWLQE